MADTCAEPVSLALAAREAHLSRYHFARAFRRAFGTTPHQFLVHKRIENACKLLAQGKTVTQACVDVGFSSVGSFSSLFKRQIGRSPSEYRRAAMRQYLAQRFVPYCFLQAAGLTLDAS